MKSAGVWIDTREANIVILDDSRITVRSVFSGLSKKLSIEGETSKKTERGYTGFDFKSSQMNRFQEELNKYLQIVISELEDCHELYLFGPGETKLILEKELKRKRGISINVVKVETSDNLTPNQLIGKVRNFYSSRSRIKPIRRKFPLR